MFATFLNNFFNMLVAIVNIFATPINTYVINHFPDFAIVVNNFNTFINTYVGNTLAWFGALLPPITRSLLIFYLGYLLVRFLMVLVVHSVLMIIQMLKNIKFW